MRRSLHHSAGVRPLVVRFGALGDMVLLGAALRELSVRYQTPVDVLTSGEWSKWVVEGQPGVGTVYRVASRKRPFWMSPSQWHVVHQLKERPPGPVWFLDTSHAGRQLLTRAGIDEAHVIDFNAVTHSSLDHILTKTSRVIQRSPKAYPPIYSLNLEDPMIKGSLLELPASWRAAFERWLAQRPFANQRVLLFQPGNSVTTRRGRLARATNLKYWSLNHWAAVLQECAALYPEHALLLIGTAQEARLNEKIATLANRPQIHNVSKDLPLDRLLALCNYADGMVSVDTGPAHLASAVGLPMVVLFGPSRPSEYRPISAYGSQVVCVDTPKPPYLRYVEVRQVIEAVHQLVLKRTPLL